MNAPYVIPKQNNLNLLRLIFAFQVFFVHLSHHISDFSLPKVVHHFPGVPCFFFISGFLIYQSCISLPTRNYFINRFLRLFPGIIFATFGAILVIFVAKDAHFLYDNIFLIVTWIFSQITLGQAFNPSQFRDIGVGVLNGSLWTITVEILFYLICPVIVFFEKKIKHFVFFIIIISIFVFFSQPLFDEKVYRSKTIYDFLALTPFVWGWMFGFGIITSKYFNRIIKKLKYLSILSLFFVLSVLIIDFPYIQTSGNSLNPFYFVGLSILILYLAFQIPVFSFKNDLSYGIYV